MSAPKPNVTNDKKAARQKAAATRVRSSELPVAWIMMLGLIVAIGPLSIRRQAPSSSWLSSKATPITILLIARAHLFLRR